MTSTNIKKLVLFLLLTGFSIFILLVIIIFSTYDVDDVEKHSIKFLLGAPDHLGSIELIKECRIPTYSWKGRDGESIPVSSIDFGSTAPKEEIIQFYRTAFEKQMCKDARPTTTATSKLLLSLSCKNQLFVSARVFMETESGCKKIIIDFIDND